MLAIFLPRKRTEPHTSRFFFFGFVVGSHLILLSDPFEHVQELRVSGPWLFEALFCLICASALKMKKIIQQIWVFIGRAGLVIILFLLVVYTSKRIHRTYILVRQSVSDWSGFVSVYHAQDYSPRSGKKRGSSRRSKHASKFHRKGESYSPLMHAKDF
jgi:hypothetical protein